MVDQNAPKNPCVRHCCLNHENVCVGCYRTLDEILAWHNATAEQKIEIIDNANRRRHQKRGATKFNE